MVVLLLAVAATPPAQAQTYEVLHRFHGKPDGENPNAGVIRDAAGNLYSTTSSGGTYGWGVVFKLSTTRKLTVLHTFTDGADGASPLAGVVRDAEGNLYGTTYGGGDSNCFRPSPPSGGRSTRWDDLPPIPQGGCGVVFKVDTTGNETVLHTFTGADGNEPDAGLIRDLAGNLYGTTLYGGDVNCNVLNSCGVVFKLDTTGKETVLYRFSGGADGSSPEAGLVQDAAGNLYGTTVVGGDLE